MAEQPSYIFLSDNDLAALSVTTADVIAAIEDTVHSKAAGRVWTTPKAAVMPGDGRYAMATLAGSDDLGLVAVKSVMVCPENAARGLPGINGGIMLLNAQTGVLAGMISANWVTAVRTAGLSAVMARRLANPESRSIAFVGTGVQARSHLDAFAEMFALNDVHVVGRSQAGIDRFCAYAEGKGLQARGFEQAQEALEGADIVVSSITLDYSVQPFLDASWLKPGAFAAITDLAIPWEDAGMSAFGAVFVDDREQEAAMDKPMVAPELISGDLESVVLGETPAAFNADAASAFVFRGLALGDLAVAGMAFNRAL
ncbi:MAG: ornithine cyclodeaminase family protein [Rhodobacteraceae bacterium]|nr:ornithine cyclodeaminase family protein [Paracoccaceae bacterium]